MNTENHGVAGVAANIYEVFMIMAMWGRCEVWSLRTDLANASPCVADM